MPGEEYVMIKSLAMQVLKRKERLTPVQDFLQTFPFAFALYAHELQACVVTYNLYKQGKLKPSPPFRVYRNAAHLVSTSPSSLPAVADVNRDLQQSAELHQPVVEELLTAPRFTLIYAMEKPAYLLTNIIALIYQVSLWHRYPVLRQKETNIFAALAEMSGHLYLNDISTNVFSAVRSWIAEWQREGYSQELARRIKEQ